MTDRDLGIALIRLWYENNFPIQGAMSFSDVLAFYDQVPAHVEAIGKAVRIAELNQDDEKKALSRLRSPDGDPHQLPHYQGFMTALSNQEINNAGFTWTHVSQALAAGVSDTVSVVEKTAVVAGSAYLLYAGIGLAVALYLASRSQHARET